MFWDALTFITLIFIKELFWSVHSGQRNIYVWNFYYLMIKIWYTLNQKWKYLHSLYDTGLNNTEFSYWVIWVLLWLWDPKVRDLNLNLSSSILYFCCLIQGKIPSGYWLLQSSKPVQQYLGKTLPEWLAELFHNHGEKSNQEKRQKVFSQMPFTPGQKSSY